MTQPTANEKRRRKLVYWLFTLTVAMWAVAFALFYVVYLAQVVVVGGSALGAAFVSSLIVFVIAAVLSVAIYLISERLAQNE